MNVPMLLAGIAIGAAIVVVLWLVYERRRSEGLHQRFGPEYERAVRETGSRRVAEADLQEREKRVASFEIRELRPEERQRFADDWRQVQARFVDEPREAVGEADRLVGELMSARGYPMADFEQRAADVSVDHPQVVDHYRMAHRIAGRRGGATNTEDLRQAMVHYRALFSDLLESSGAVEGQPDADQRSSAVASGARPEPEPDAAPGAEPVEARSSGRTER